MLLKTVRVLASTAAVLGVLSLVPSLTERAGAQQRGFQGQYRPGGFMPRTRPPAALRPNDVVIPAGLGIFGGGGQQGGGGQCGFGGRVFR